MIRFPKVSALCSVTVSKSHTAVSSKILMRVDASVSPAPDTTTTVTRDCATWRSESPRPSMTTRMPATISDAIITAAKRKRR